MLKKLRKQGILIFPKYNFYYSEKLLYLCRKDWQKGWSCDMMNAT